MMRKTSEQEANMITVPEPPTKRKTLIERAGETINPLRSHLPGASKPSISRSDSTSAQVGGRGGPVTFNRSRNTSNASVGSCASSIRPTSRGHGFKQLRQQSVPEMPPEYEEDAETGVMGKRKGTPLLSLNPANTERVTLRKTRTHGDLQQQYRNNESRVQQPEFFPASGDGRVFECAQGMVSRQPSVFLQHDRIPNQVSRNISLSTAFAGLSITPKDARKRSDNEREQSLQRIREDSSPSKIPKYAAIPTLRHAQSCQTLQTPSPLKHKASINGLRTPATSMHRKNELPRFLTKEKLTPIAAWDTKGRLEDMVSLFAPQSTVCILI
jgi:kinesin family protein C1